MTWSKTLTSGLIHAISSWHGAATAKFTVRRNRRRDPAGFPHPQL